MLEDALQVFTPQSSSQFPWKIIAGILVFLILVLLGFNFVFDRYGKFWERGTTSRISPAPTPSVTS